MKQLQHALTALIIAMMAFFSCKKEPSGIINPNKSPSANAGKDQVITIPIDSVLLNGSGSTDVDGTITQYHWKKISDFSPCIIVSPDSVLTTVRNLIPGSYNFELIVTDNKGAVDRDTVRVTVNSIDNLAPLANAGQDITVYLPDNSCRLNGSSSHDPDGMITAYQWKKIAGPYAVITNQNDAQADVTNLTEGIYNFELSVTDNKGATATDVVQVNVLNNNSPCATERPQVNATLTHIGNLSLARIPYVGAAGSKIVFAGGMYYSEHNYYDVSPIVDIYDINTHEWTTAQLTSAKEGIAVASCGSKIFFGGGGKYFVATNEVDIYDASTGKWTSANLSEPKMFSAAATVGSKVFFAGGYKTEESISNTMDVYDVTTNKWSVIRMPNARAEFSAVTVDDKIYFAGGFDNGGYTSSQNIDISDVSDNGWSTASLQELAGVISGVAKGNEVYWAGELNGACRAVTFNPTNFSKSVSCLSYTRRAPSAVIKNNDIAFFSQPIGYMGNDSGPLSNQFDIFNTAIGQWSLGVLPSNVGFQSMIQVNNTVYMAGGVIGDSKCSREVYIVNW